MKKQGKIEIRAYIKGCIPLCIPPKQIYNELNDIYGSFTVSSQELEILSIKNNNKKNIPVPTIYKKTQGRKQKIPHPTVTVV